jgi:glycosyl-4,4'-diaponeurosporenoate acyltransferase
MTDLFGLAVVDAVVWAGLSVGAGYLCHRLPARWLAGDRVPFRLLGLERDGRWYERRLRIKRWKDRVPEAGDVFRGGFSKRAVRARDPAHLARFVVETRRAELTHWLLLAAAPFFFLWNPWWLGAVMVVYALVANVPCLVIQRYNRVRLVRVLAAAKARHPHTPRGV